MALKHYKPYTKTTRFKINSDYSDITKDKPEKSLTVMIGKRQGRNNQGRITVRRRGTGNKRLYRIIDFKRIKDNVPAKVAAIEYDPNRSARIALLHYADGEKRYIIAPLNLEVGAAVVSGKESDIQIGNALPLRYIPLGTVIHNVELFPERGAQLARSAGAYVELVAKEGKYALLKLPSGEVRRVLQECRATIGQVGNIDHDGVVVGKAGKSRWMGRRPKVRGVAMNPVDHPHGGGEGKTASGRHPVTPWGKQTKGAKTRRKKYSDRLIVKRRSKKKKD